MCDKGRNGKEGGQRVMSITFSFSYSLYLSLYKASYAFITFLLLH